MPETYEIDRKRELVVSRGWKSITDRELRAHYERLEADAAFDPGYKQLIDLREVKNLSLSNSGMLGTALRHVFRSGVPRAIVVATDEQFEVAQRFAAYSEADGQLIHVFRDVARARDWLGV